MDNKTTSNIKYIILDSNSFIYLLDGQETITRAISKLRCPHNNQESYIIISAYTLYELIQNMNEIERIREFRDQIIQLGDFWVCNSDSVLEHHGLEYGIDFLFSLRLNSDELLLEFSKEREQLRKKVYQALFPKMFEYAKLVSSAFLALRNCEVDGTCDYDTLWRIRYIDRYFFDVYRDRYILVFSEAYKHAGLPSYDISSHQFYNDYNAKDSLRELMLNLIIEILSVSDVELQMAKKGIRLDNTEYNKHIIENYKVYSKTITSKSFARENIACKKRFGNRMNIDSVLSLMMDRIPASLTKECYVSMVKKLFSSGGFGKSFNNDFIDFSNICLLNRFPEGTAIFITNDSYWRSFLLSHKDNSFARLSADFYENKLSNC